MPMAASRSSTCRTAALCLMHQQTAKISSSRDGQGTQGGQARGGNEPLLRVHGATCLGGLLPYWGPKHCWCGSLQAAPVASRACCMMHSSQQQSMCSMRGIGLLVSGQVPGLTHLRHLLLCCWVTAHCDPALRSRLALDGLQRCCLDSKVAHVPAACPAGHRQLAVHIHQPRRSSRVASCLLWQQQDSQLWPHSAAQLAAES